MKVLLEETIDGLRCRLVAVRGKFKIEIKIVGESKLAAEYVFNDVLEAAFRFRDIVADEKQIASEISGDINGITKLVLGGHRNGK